MSKREILPPFFNTWIENRRVLYERTRNPIHALDVYRLTRSLKTEIPGWVLELFDRWAKVLCEEQPEGGGMKIAKALGLVSKGGGPPLTTQAKIDWRNVRIVQRVLELRDAEGQTLDEAFYKAADEFPSLTRDGVSGIWYELMGDAKL
jgi:hypothetical protein